MKFLYIATLTLLVLTAVNARSVPVDDESLGDDIKNYFDQHITFKFVDALTPVISRQVHDTLQRVTKDMIGGTVEDVIDHEWSEFVGSKWAGEGWPFVEKNIIGPIKARALDFRSRWEDKAVGFYEEISKGAEAVSVQGIKKGIDDYFAVGDAHKSFSTAVNLTHGGVEGWVQGKLEAIHAGIMYESKPLLHGYVFSLKPQILSFVQDTVQDIVEEIVGKDIASTALGHKAVLWIASTFQSLCALVADRALDKAASDAFVMNNKVLREELYRPFSFLRGDVERINANVH
jgi:hypothetical protein